MRTTGLHNILLLAVGSIVTSFGNNIYVVKIEIDWKLKIECCHRQWIFEHRYADGCGGVTNGGTESSHSRCPDRPGLGCAIGEAGKCKRNVWTGDGQ